MTVVIKPILPQDKPRWAQLWYEYLDFYDTSLPLMTYEQTFEQLFSDNPYSPNGLLAWIDDQPVGLVHFIFHAHCWRPEGACYLQDLYTSDLARNQGVGRALIEAVYKAADARDTPYVYWMTQDFNADARRLYDKVAEVTDFVKYQRPQ